MTKWQDIKRLRLACHTCEGAFSVPFASVKDRKEPGKPVMLTACPFCSEEINDGLKLASSLQTILRIVSDEKFNFDVFVESEEDEPGRK